MNLVKRPAAVTSSERPGPNAYCRAASRHKRSGATSASLAPPRPPRYLIVGIARSGALREEPSHAEVFVGNRRFPALLRRRLGANRGADRQYRDQGGLGARHPGGRRKRRRLSDAAVADRRPADGRDEPRRRDDSAA